MSDMISDLHTDDAALYQEKCIQRRGDFDNIAVLTTQAHRDLNEKMSLQVTAAVHVFMVIL